MRFSLSGLILLGAVGALIYDVVTASPGKSFLSFLLSRATAHVPTTLVEPPKVEVEATPRPTVLKQIQESGKLITTEVQLERVVPATQKSKIAFIGEVEQAKLVLIAEGKVGVGIDLKKITQSDIKESETKVVINLPNPEVLYTEVVASKIYDQSQNIWFPPQQDLDLRGTAEAAAKKEFQAAATSCEVYKKAEDEAKKVLVSLINKIGDDRSIEILESNKRDCTPVASPSPLPSNPVTK
ncbi:hypothetical protein OsccyDRAFT_0554 [Leptolyngbyaceae cyanobacterium JSC-12]|nr:hypothetical protein OsccyDRAFT_0554 [Leptolyngbyaceae cyanobacterium JSC-12]